MDISKLYEKAAEMLKKATDISGESKIEISSVTLINTAKDNVFAGVNWKRLNDSFEEEATCSETEAIIQMLLAGESEIQSIVTLTPDQKIPASPCQKCQELIIRLNPLNKNSKVLTGKNSQVILTSLNSEIAKYAEQFTPPEKEEKTSTPAQAAEAPVKAEKADNSNEPEGSAAHTGIDATGLKMIFDDWESSEPMQNTNESKPFGVNSLSMSQTTEKAENAKTEVDPNNNPNMNMQQQQPMNMYGQQPMNMYGQQPMNMYGQQPMNMYGQQPMNMYGQQPMNMYGQQPMNMYGQQPMNMYGQQPMNMYGQQQPMNMYAQQQSMNMYGQQQPMNNMNGQGANQQSLYLNQMPQQQSVQFQPQPNFSNNMQAPIKPGNGINTKSVSVYSTNINDSDNNAIFKDRLNDILNSSSSKPHSEDSAEMKDDALQSAKERKNAAKNESKFKRQKKNEFN
ncbi:MAG: hypothetical protein E7505_09265 [Ruminococcus sp.]|nr:hypothetical protein [Ruminococcus sp.]